MSPDFIKSIAARGRVSLDVQGFLRTVANQKVVLTDWGEKNEILSCIDILKADDQEMQVITGCTDTREGASLLAEWGVQEVVITSGNKGSLIYTSGEFYDIPAFVPHHISDETGCGDTYMAGYLAQRILGIVPHLTRETQARMAAMQAQASKA